MTKELKPEDLVQNRKYNIPTGICNPYLFLYKNSNKYLFVRKDEDTSWFSEEDLDDITEHRELIKNSGEYWVRYNSENAPEDISEDSPLDLITGLNTSAELYGSKKAAQSAMSPYFPDIKKFHITAEELPMEEIK